MRRFALASFLVLTLAAPALAGNNRGSGGRGFDPSGADAEMLQAAAKAGQLVNMNQATTAFQTWWSEEDGENRTIAEFRQWLAERQRPR